MDLYKLSKDELILLITKLEKLIRQEMHVKLEKLDIYEKVYGELRKEFCRAPNCEHYQIRGDYTYTSADEESFEICNNCGEMFCKYHAAESLIDDYDPAQYIMRKRCRANNKCRHYADY